MRVKIRLDTNSELLKFIRTVTAINEDVTIDDGAGNRVSAKSCLVVPTRKWSLSTFIVSATRILVANF